MSVAYSDYKFNYTTGGEFTLTGSDYVGYFNISQGEPYTGRYRTSNSKSLSPTTRIKSDLYLSNLFTDRLIVDDINLPNTLDEILIPPNEIVSKTVFNAHLEKIYNNTLYLYSKLFIASNDIPVGYNYVAAVSTNADNWGWIPQSKGSAIGTDPFSNIGLGELDNIVGAQSVEFVDKTGYALFAISPTHFIALSSDTDKTNITVTLSTPYVDTNTIKTYTALSGISLSGDNLYITDAAENLVYKYNIAGFYNGDLSITNKKFLIEVMGGYGSYDRKNKFNKPVAILAADNRVYISDTNNKAVKIYDNNFNWIKTISLRRANTSICSISYNKLYGLLYIVAHREDIDQSELWIADKSFNIIDKIILDESTQDSSEQVIADRKGRVFLNKNLNEKFCGVAFSEQDSNIFYLYSNRGVYKKFISRPDKTIGKWLFGNFGLVYYHIWNFEFINFNENYILWNTLSGASQEDFYIKNLSIIPQPGNADTIFLFAQTGRPAAGRIMHYDEYTLYDSTLYETDLNLYTSLRQNQKKDEYIQALTFNKEIYKQVHNILTLKNLIRGRFKGEFDVGGNLVYKQYSYLQDYEIENLMISALENLATHDNEHISSEVINRIFKIIFDIQQSILTLSTTNIVNFLPPAALTGANIVVVD